jgi:hypothetical protein
MSYLLHHLRCNRGTATAAQFQKTSQSLFPLDHFGCNNASSPNSKAILDGKWKIFQGKFMWLEKLCSGVLRILTPLGPRYLKPSFPQRLYLLWVFRNFPSLPVKVLTSRQLRLIEAMCAENRFVSFGVGVDDAPLLGTLEQRPPILDFAPPRSPGRATVESMARFATDVRRR